MFGACNQDEDSSTSNLTQTTITKTGSHIYHNLQNNNTHTLASSSIMTTPLPPSSPTMSTTAKEDPYAVERQAVAQEEQIVKAQQIAGYKFRNVLYLKEALQVPPYTRMTIGNRTLNDGNMTLATIGDTALKTVLSREWYSTNTSRGHWNSHYASSVLSDEGLASVCRETGLKECMQYPNEQELFHPGKKAEATLVEAVAGAIFLDADIDCIDAVELFVENMKLLEQTRRNLGTTILRRRRRGSDAISRSAARGWAGELSEHCGSYLDRESVGKRLSETDVDTSSSSSRDERVFIFGQ